MDNKTNKRIRLKKKIRSKIFGEINRPRLSIFRSNKFIYAQIIDDFNNVTLVEANDLKLDKGTKIERAKFVGKNIAEKAVAKKIKEVIFDRNGFRYTGRVKLVADSAREFGLKF